MQVVIFISCVVIGCLSRSLDNDARMTRAEEKRPTFDDIDYNGDGIVTSEEHFQYLVSSVGVALAERDNLFTFGLALDKYDLNGNGQVEKSEYDAVENPDKNN